MSDNARFGEVYNNLPLPLVILAPDWTIEGVNTTFSLMFGRDTAQLAGIPAGDIFSEVSAAGQDSDWNISTIVSPEGELHQVAFRVNPLPSGGFILLLIPQRDGFGLSAVVASKISESAEDASSRQLSLLGHLTGGVAHDLNNTLTGVLGHLSLLRQTLGPDAMNPSLIAAEDGARKACATAHQILEFVRGGERHRETVDLGEIVRKVTRLLGISFQKNIVIHTELENVPIFGNESEISQLLINLAINARDAMPSGGKLSIALRKLPDLIDGVEHAVLSVSDTGQGIPEEVRSRVFEPFFTTKRGGKGTGLGLSNVKKSVESLGGSVRFDSAVGSGTTFEVQFPLSSTQPLQREQIAVAISEAEQILIAEDEETVRIVMQRSLEHLGYTVQIACNGREAIEVFNRSPDLFDLVILDVMMPEMPGDELFFKLREIRPDIPILIASGYASDLRTRKMLDAGCCGYIHKPFGVEDLASEVRRCIDAYGG